MLKNIPIFQNKKTCTLSLLFLLVGFAVPTSYSQSGTDKKISHVFYISANTGLATPAEAEKLFKTINTASQADAAATLLLTGNITTKNGFPRTDKENTEAKKFLQKNLLDHVRNFNGKVVFTPGYNEWSHGPQSINNLESFLQDNSKVEFWPNDGCSIDRQNINDQVQLVLVDSQWFLEDWDEHPQINRKCQYKTREEFLMEFKDELKDNFGKTKIVTIHHPVMSNTKFNVFERVTRFTNQSFEHKQQKELRGRLDALASQFDDVIFVSGNHKNLQYLDNGRNPQIISGASGETSDVKNPDEGHFASEEKGYSRLTVFKDGSSKVEFFHLSEEDKNPVFSKNIERELPTKSEVSYPPKEDFGDTHKASIYTEEETDKSDFFVYMWGEHNRQLYSRKVEAPVLFLEDLPGNVKPIAEGGGQQSRTIRIINDNKNEYNLRELKKSAGRYIQADVVPQTYIRDRIERTVLFRVVQDFFTTAHPYAPFAINELSEPLDILHPNPRVYFIPKQEGLGIFNDDYGNKLYMLEEHVGDENKGFEDFGKPDDIISTHDMLLAIRKDKTAYVDQEEYIKARLFDMVLGDFDRHQDQWRWAEYQQEDGRKMYQPIPRDRDQAFPNYDGNMLALAKLAIPLLRKMQPYENEIQNYKWLNWSGYPLDKSFITTAGWETWKEQAEFIKNNLSDAQIEAAFETLPEATQDESIEHIKEVLKYRRDNVEDIARTYFERFSQFETVLGTEEDDVFQVTRKENGITEIVIEKNGKEIFRNLYERELTHEIWIYGLEGDDQFNVKGNGDALIEFKIVGGVGTDTYNFLNPKNVKLYDHKSTESVILNPKSNKRLTDSYDVNMYHYTKQKYRENRVLPDVNFVPDAGFTVGVKNVLTTYNMERNPFTSQHVLQGNFYFATYGFGITYTGEFANILENVNLGIEARYTSPNYFLNYFGYGNDTEYNKNDVEKAFNRVKLEQWRISPSLIWRNNNWSSFYISPMVESIKVDYSEQDYITNVYSAENDIYDSQLYGGLEANYNFYNKNNKSFPSLGMEFDVTSGYKQNIDANSNRFGYANSTFSANYPLMSNGFAAIATKLGAEAIIGDDFEFYHASTLGGNNSLRGYRNHRFTGKYSFFQSTDVRSAFTLLETDFVPFILGLSAGFDYGRVWTENDSSNTWHTNYGGAFWINAFTKVAGTVGMYNGSDGWRLAFTFNFKY